MPKTLLLADDSVTIQKVVGITFANEDVELVTVDNGDDALVRAREIKPDLVLADIGMPGLDGYALCSALRQDPELSNTPVLLLTGTFETYDEERAREVGASGHISKPFEAQALVDRVLGLLAKAAATPAAKPAPPTRPILTAQPPVAAPQSAAAPVERPRPELPPLPGASGEKSARGGKPRTIAPFDFDVTPEPGAHAAAGAVEPLWEAEPDFEARDDAPARRAPVAAGQESAVSGDDLPAPDQTRLFAPDLLGRPADLAAASAKKPARPDFSFEDLDFEEPTAPPGNQTQIFGESSGPLGADTVLAVAMPAPVAEAPLADVSAADPLYSQTRFLDPNTAGDPPSLPDLLGGEEITAPSRALESFDLDSTEPEVEAERVDEVDPLSEPFSADTSAALDEPEFALVRPPRAEPVPAPAATRLLARSDAPDEIDEDEVPLDGDLLDVEPLRDDSDEPPAELEAWSTVKPAHEIDPRPTAPLPAAQSALLPRPRTERGVAPMVDSALLSQTVEKVAWEAFGSLSEQVVNEVRKRVEAVVWEVVPQLCERLIREEIARLKAEEPE